jgi:hypothetical protein
MSEALPVLAGRAPADLIEWGKSAIEQAASFIAVKEVRDQAEALRAYQRSVGAAQEAIDAAQEIRIRAERRMGLEIARAQQEGSAATPHRRQKGSDAATLSELGVSRHHSSEWQQLATVDEETFEAALSAAKEERRLSPSAVRKLLRARLPKTETTKNKPLSKKIKPRPKPNTDFRGRRDELNAFLFWLERGREVLAGAGDPDDFAAEALRGNVFINPELCRYISKLLTSFADATEALQATSRAEVPTTGAEP